MRLGAKIPLLSVLMLAGLGLQASVSSSELESDDIVLFFPTAAHAVGANRWEVPIHGWVVDTSGMPEKDKTLNLRPLLTKALQKAAEKLGIPSDVITSALKSPQAVWRLWWFLPTTPENDRSVRVQIGTQAQVMDPSGDDGHTQKSVLVESTAAPGTWIGFAAKTRQPEGGAFKGEAQLIPSTGTSVISDIDDTIKDSNVLNKVKLLINTFLKEYNAVPGMTEYYKRLAAQGAFFHYVSASPWRLYPSLEPFMRKFPKGTLALRKFGPEPKDLVAFIRSSRRHKEESIGNILTTYPNHKFILIGDSGEKDPEIYAEMYSKLDKAGSADKIESIQIRWIEGSSRGCQQLRNLFDNHKIPSKKWIVFENPSSMVNKCR